MKLETLKERLRRRRRPPIHGISPRLSVRELCARHDTEIRRQAFWREIKVCTAIVAIGLGACWWVA